MRRYTLSRDASSRLKDMPLFQGLSFAQLQMIAPHFDGAEAEAGEELMSQGTYSYQYIVIEEGTADVFQDGAKIGALGRGDFFGELALLGGGKPRTASIVATTPLRALVLTSHSLHQIREHVPLLAERIDAKAQERLARDAAAASGANS